MVEVAAVGVVVSRCLLVADSDGAGQVSWADCKEMDYHSLITLFSLSVPLHPTNEIRLLPIQAAGC